MNHRLRRLLGHGDLDAARALSLDAARHDDLALSRDVARVLIDHGEPWRVVCGDEATSDWRAQLLLDGRPRLLIIDRLRVPLPWDPSLARRFACACAARVLPLFERVHPQDQRPRRALDVARSHRPGVDSITPLDRAHAATWAAWTRAWEQASAASSIAAQVALDASWEGVHGASLDWEEARAAAWVARAAGGASRPALRTAHEAAHAAATADPGERETQRRLWITLLLDPETARS